MGSLPRDAIVVPWRWHAKLLCENATDLSTSRECMPLASTEITWLLRFDAGYLLMSLHETESRSFDRL
jgi:hypothetical protein